MRFPLQTDVNPYRLRRPASSSCLVGYQRNEKPFGDLSGIRRCRNASLRFDNTSPLSWVQKYLHYRFSSIYRVNKITGRTGRKGEYRALWFACFPGKSCLGIRYGGCISGSSSGRLDLSFCVLFQWPACKFRLFTVGTGFRVRERAIDMFSSYSEWPMCREGALGSILGSKGPFSSQIVERMLTHGSLSHWNLRPCSRVGALFSFRNVQGFGYKSSNHLYRANSGGKVYFSQNEDRRAYRVCNSWYFT